jgi:hypothetical protein
MCLAVMEPEPDLPGLQPQLIAQLHTCTDKTRHDVATMWTPTRCKLIIIPIN